MNLDDIRPQPGGRYRNRYTGVLAAVKHYARPGAGNAVHLVTEGGHHWWGTREEFWDQWLHADLTARKRAVASYHRLNVSPSTN